MSAIRLSVDNHFENILKNLQNTEFPLLKYPEIIKVIVGKYYTERELKKRDKWEASLPVMDLNDEESRELDVALQSGSSRIVSREELWKEVLSE